MTKPRPPKKSETLEVRIPYAAKTAFMDRCRRDGRSASEAVRGFIERELAGAPVGRGRLGWGQAIAAALAGLAIGAAAAPSLAHAMSDPRAAFDRLDRNHDGLVTFEEFQTR